MTRRLRVPKRIAIPATAVACFAAFGSCAGLMTAAAPPATPVAAAPAATSTVTATATVTATVTVQPPAAPTVTRTVERVVERTVTQAAEPATESRDTPPAAFADVSPEQPGDVVDRDATAAADPAPDADAPAPDSGPFRNCAAARDAGATPLHRGDPGWADKLDRDGDGIACES